VNQSYQQFIEEVDRLASRLSARYARHLVCRAGCSGCCHHHLSVFSVEAAAVSDAVKALPDETRRRVAEQACQVEEAERRGTDIACPLLVDERCAIYESRPLICRTQGLPLMYEAADGEQEVDFCPLNFTAPNAVDDLDEAQLVPLDALNLKLALINLQYCHENGIEPAHASERHKMSDVIAQTTRT
jgi:Fe-S-cluster containining protein